MSCDRFEHRPLKFVNVALPNIVFVGLDDREEFDKIAAPCIDHGPKDNGHVLTKQVGDYGENSVTVIFQYWLKSLTADAFLADAKKRQEAGQ